MSDRLTGRRVLVTRERPSAGTWVERLEAHGASVDARAILAFEPARDRRAARQAVAQLERYAWVVFSSANGARFFAALCRDEGVSRPDALRAAAIGPATAVAAREVGWRIDFACTGAAGADFGAVLAPAIGTGCRALVVRPETGRPELAAALRGGGVKMDEAVVYRTIAAPDVAAVAADVACDRYDAIVFTSPSTLAFLLACETNVEGLRAALARVRRIAIGATTGDALAREALVPTAIARRPDADGILAAVVAAAAV